jgi:hypothetical protein
MHPAAEPHLNPCRYPHVCILVQSQFDKTIDLCQTFTMAEHDLESHSNNESDTDANIQVNAFNPYTNAERIQQLSDIDKVSSRSVVATGCICILICIAHCTSLKVRWFGCTGPYCH